MRVAVVKKKPDEKFAVGFKYSTADIAADATIQNCTVEITPTGDADDLAVVGVPSIDDYTVAAMIEKGRDGYEYYVTFTITTSAGQIFQDKIFVKVRA